MMTAIVATFMIPIVGLGFDVTLLYLVKAKLASASDAASLAAARSLSSGLTLDQQSAAAISRAQVFFDGNYPASYLTSSSTSRTADVAETAYKTRTVTVNSAATMPLYFLRTLGYNSTTVSAVSKTSRRDVNMIIVLDRSGSMQTSGSCEPMKTAANMFIDKFANGRDRLALITFNTQAYQAYAPNLNFKTSTPTLSSVVSDIACTSNTNTSAAYSQAYQMLQSINEPGALNLIVLFTDGLPTAISASLPVKMSTDTRYGDGFNPYNGTTTLYNMPPSGCKDSAGRTYTSPGWNPADKRGVMTGGTNYTAGIFTETASSVNDASNHTPIPDNAGCAFVGVSQYAVRRDAAYIPDYDVYGNNLRCCYQSVNSFPSGPYVGKIRIDDPLVFQRTGANAADSAALRVRNDLNLGVTTYVIGLGNPATGEAPDEVLMRRMANDPTSPTYDPTKMTGLYVFAASSADLSAAFSKVASEILRIAQ